jgi:eukaryotic-like serine/threonine-protein kinase
MKGRRRGRVRSALLDFGTGGAGGMRGFGLRLFIAATGVLCGLILFNYVLMPRVVRHGDTVRIPAVAGKPLGEAEKILRRAGLDPVLVAARHHPDVPQGCVLELSPPVGLSVKRGRQVFLTPSIGAISHFVPDVTGLSLRMARLQLSEAGLRVSKTEYAATNLVSADQVLAMAPEAGSPASTDGTVTLLVSRPRAPVPYWLPDLRGRDGRGSAIWLEANGFRAALTEGPSSGAPGSVVTQDPAPGTPIWVGSRIDLAVAPGRPTGRTPGRSFGRGRG